MSSCGSREHADRGSKRQRSQAQQLEPRNDGRREEQLRQIDQADATVRRVEQHAARAPHGRRDRVPPVQLLGEQTVERASCRSRFPPARRCARFGTAGATGAAADGRAASGRPARRARSGEKPPVSRTTSRRHKVNPGSPSGASRKRVRPPRPSISRNPDNRWSRPAIPAGGPAASLAPAHGAAIVVVTATTTAGILHGRLHAREQRTGRVARAGIGAAHVAVVREVHATVQRVAAALRVALDDQQPRRRRRCGTARAPALSAATGGRRSRTPSGRSARATTRARRSCRPATTITSCSG